MSLPDLGMDAPVGLAIAEADLRLVAVNNTLAGWLGAPATDLVGRPLQEFLPVPSQLFIETHVRPLLAMQHQVREVSLELGSDRMPVLFNADRSADGRVHVALIDIRDRRGYENELQKARQRAEVEAARHALVAAVGPRLVHALDLQETGEIAVAHAVPALADACLLELWERGSVHSGEDELVQMFTASGPRAARGSLAPAGPQFASFPVAEGRIGQLTFLAHGVAADWNEVRLAEYAELVGLALDRAALHQQAQEEIRARETLIGMLAHEFANPLSALQLQVTLWRRTHKDPLSTEVESLLGVVERNVEQMDRLVNDMLDVSRIRSGRFELSPRTADLAEVARQTVDRMQPYFAAHGTTIDVEVQPAPCRIDPARMQQVVANLLTNAVKYGAPPYNVKVEKARDAVRLDVIDHGQGIAPEDRERLFRQFERLGSTVEEGTGLGLYIVQHMVTAHGGQVQVHETPGGGATFRVTIPV